MALDTNLIAYWKLDESSGNAADSVGSATLTNANVTYAPGKINNGAVFNSSTDHLTTSTYTPFDFERTDSFSFSFWLDLVALGVNQAIFSHMNPSADYAGYVLLENSSGQLSFNLYYKNSTNEYITVNTPSSSFTTTMSHVVVTYAGTGVASGIKIYINGTDQSLTVTSDTLGANSIKNSADFTLGNRADSLDLNGLIDEFGIWSRVLTSTEVTSLYNGGSGLAYPFPSSNNGAGFFMMM